MKLSKLTNYVFKHPVIPSAIYAGAITTWFYASGNHTHPFWELYAPSEEVPAYKGVFEGLFSLFVPWMSLKLLGKYKSNRFVNLVRAIKLELKMNATKSFAVKEQALHEYANCFANRTASLHQLVSMYVKMGLYSKSIAAIHEFAYSNEEPQRDITNYIARFGQLLHHVIIKPINYLSKTPERKAQQVLNNVVASISEGVWEKAEENITRICEDEDVPLHYKVHFAELADALELPHAIWDDVIEEAKRQREIKRHGKTNVWELKTPGLEETIKFVQGSSEDLLAQYELTEYLQTIIDPKEDDVMRVLTVMPYDDGSLLVYRHLDGELLSNYSFMNGHELLQGTRSLARILARADHELIDLAYISDCSSVPFESDVFSHKYFNRVNSANLDEDDLIAFGNLGRVLAPRVIDGMPLVIDRDANRKNTVHSPLELTGQFDITLRGKTFVSAEFAKYLGHGVGIPQGIEGDAVRRQHVQEFINIFNSDGPQKLHLDSLEFAVQSALPLKAASYYLFAQRKGYVPDVNQFLLNGMRSLVWLGQHDDFDNTEKNALADAYAVFEKLRVQHERGAVQF